MRIVEIGKEIYIWHYDTLTFSFFVLYDNSEIEFGQSEDDV